jgi:mannose/cellobiose epimerase-like protein (N-acyl-D-glucosamine 2-epimerase family)
MVIDKNGDEMKVGQLVCIPDPETKESRLYLIDEIDETRTTINEPGHWFEATEVMPRHDGPYGQEGMLSYTCEIIADECKIEPKRQP